MIIIQSSHIKSISVSWNYGFHLVHLVKNSNQKKIIFDFLVSHKTRANFAPILKN